MFERLIESGGAHPQPPLAPPDPDTEDEPLPFVEVLRADEARQIPDGHGLLIYRNRGAVLLRMTPWYERSGGKALNAQRGEVEGRRITGVGSVRQ